MNSQSMVDKVRKLGMHVIAGELRERKGDGEGRRERALYAVDDFRELLDA